VTISVKNAKKVLFSKLFSGFHFWTFLKMSKIHFPFDFMEKSCDCDGELFIVDILLPVMVRYIIKCKNMHFYRHFQNISVILFYVLAFKL
jgi:hypothetical protein